MTRAAPPHLPEALFPRGQTVQGWVKCIQFDLEAKGGRGEGPRGQAPSPAPGEVGPGTGQARVILPICASMCGSYPQPPSLRPG